MRFICILFLSLLFTCCKKEENSSGLGTSKTKIKTIVMGSSIVFGGGASNYNNSWVGLLTSNNTDDSIINFGRSGYTTYQFLPTNFTNAPVPPDTSVNISAVLKQKPDLVIVSITTNDIANGYKPATFLTNIKLITDSLQKHSIKYLITSTTLRGDLSMSLNDSLFVLAHRLRDSYQNRYVEIMSSIGDTLTLKPRDEFYSSDRIHPNNAGHYQIFSRVNPIYRSIRN
jgi:acyl-CoA thioesterase I